MSVDAEDAGQIIGELRAFWRFLSRAYSVESAEVILEMLTDDDADQLEAALSDESNFGMAKSFVMAGRNAGYDMTNQAEMNRFMLAYNSSLRAASTVVEVEEDDDAEVARLRPGRAGTIRNTERVGRNAPCPCGSGRKYKKCCGG